MVDLEFAPHPLLRPFVRLVWCFELDAAAEFGPPERIAPDGIVEMVFHYRVPMAVRYAGESFETPPRSSPVSQTRRFLEIVPAGPTGLVSVRFHPWGAYHFFALPVCDLADRVVPAEQLWGRDVQELEERLTEAGNAQARVALVERFLLQRLRHHQKADVEGLVRAIWKRRGQVRVAQLCRDLGLTARQLRRVFSASLGMPPKGFARLARFLHACAALRARNGKTLTEVGLDCGYYDQAHFIADFRAHSGMTPGQFLAGRGLAFLEVD